MSRTDTNIEFDEYKMSLPEYIIDTLSSLFEKININNNMDLSVLKEQIDELSNAITQQQQVNLKRAASLSPVLTGQESELDIDLTKLNLRGPKKRSFKKKRVDYMKEINYDADYKSKLRPRKSLKKPSRYNPSDFVESSLSSEFIE